MFWGDKIAQKIQEVYNNKIASATALIIRDEKTASGRVHVGSLRGVAIHGVISEILSEKKIKNKFFFEINDYDPMDGLPVYLDQEKFKPFMGKPLCNVPSPDGKAKNYAEYFAEEFIGVIEYLDFKPEYYRSSDLYKQGKFNEAIRKSLERANIIRKIYKEVSGADKKDAWLALGVICEKCGNVGSTKATDFDGETVAYTCGDYVTWAKGCGHAGRISPFDGRAKLPWKVEWPAKFMIMNVDIEGGGKDHSTRGGSREIADRIAREVFEIEPPLNIPYEFFQVGGKKMSSSKGAGTSSREIADLLPEHILRLLLIQKEYGRVIEFEPAGDTIPVLFDTYDKLAVAYFSGIKDDTTRIFELIHNPEERKHLKLRIFPRFSLVAYLSQMPHVDAQAEIEKMEGKKMSKDDIDELNLRLKYAKIWLDTYAPPDFKFEIQKELPVITKDLNSNQKLALKTILAYFESKTILDGQELHTRLHDIRKELNIEPKDFFSAVYLSILGKESGPKAGWFLSVLDKKFIENRFKDVLNS